MLPISAAGQPAGHSGAGSEALSVMMLWVEPMMWWLCKAFASIAQMVGLLGLLVFMGCGLWELTDLM